MHVEQNETVMCEASDNHTSANCEPMQAHAIASTPSLHSKGVVYVTTLYRCTYVKCRRVTNITTEVRMPHP